MTNREKQGSSAMLWAMFILLVLKLAVAPQISWWLVFAPIWFPMFMICVLGLVIAILERIWK